MGAVLVSREELEVLHLVNEAARKTSAYKHMRRFSKEESYGAARRVEGADL